LEPGAIQQLVSYAWPGNVRELEHVIKRSALLARGEILTIHDLEMPLPKEEKSTSDTSQDRFAYLAAALRDAYHEASAQTSHHNGDAGIFHRLIGYAETVLITEALRVSDGNQVLAAKKLGLHRNTLRSKLPKDER
jgi:DNA-binding NtrC family response regulator